MPVSLHTTRPEDLSAITTIYADAVLHGASSYEIEPPSLAEIQRRFDTLWQSGWPTLVAREEDRVVGYAYAGPYRPRPGYRFMLEDSVYVAPDAQGRGVGKQLLSALIEKCRERGIRQVLAVIGDAHEQNPSVVLHWKLGFRACGLIEGSGFKHGRWLDTALMQLPLNGGNETLPEEFSGHDY